MDGWNMPYHTFHRIFKAFKVYSCTSRCTRASMFNLLIQLPKKYRQEF